MQVTNMQFKIINIWIGIPEWQWKNDYESISFNQITKLTFKKTKKNCKLFWKTLKGQY